MKLAQWLLVSAAAAVLAVGCGGDKDKDKGGSGGAGGSSGGSAKINHGSPKDLVDSLYQISKNNDLLAFADCVEPDLQPTFKPVFAAMSGFMAKNAELAKLVDEKFGKEMGDKVRGETKDKKMMPDMKGDPSKAKIDTQGDKATVTMEGEAKPLDLKKVAGKWYVTIPEAEKPKPAEVEQMKTMMEKMGKAQDEVIKKIKDGTIKKENYEEESAKIMMGAMMGGAGGSSD